MTGYLLDSIPGPIILVGTIVVTTLAIEVGYVLGRRRLKRTGEEERGQKPAAALHGTILALLAFLLAFAFGMAANRHDARKKLVLAEANSIGTCFLRAEMLPPPFDTEARALLLEYVDTRLSAVRPGELDAAIAGSEQLHAQLWTQAVEVSRLAPQSYTSELYIQSLNALIDLHEDRMIAGVHDRLPGVMWIVLYIVAILGMLSLGYHLAISDSRRALNYLPLAVAFSLVFSLIADVDRPRAGLLMVGQQALEDVRETMIGLGGERGSMTDAESQRLPDLTP